MVGLISTDKSKDHLSHSISLCSDRKTYAGDADSFTKNQSTTLNWQRTYKLRNTANGLVLTDISAGVDLFTATINLTYLHPIISGANQPFYAKTCQVFKLAVRMILREKIFIYPSKHHKSFLILILPI